MLMTDKNGKEIKTGDIVKIDGGYFKADNGTFLVKHSPGDPSWSGSDYSLRKCNKKGEESVSKYATAFWPLMVTVSSREKYCAAKQHNRENATIEIIGSVKVYELNVKESRGWNDYEYKEIATEKRYNELLTYRNTKIEIISELVNEQKAEPSVPVLVEAAEPEEIIAPEELKEETTSNVSYMNSYKTQPVINEALAKRSLENYSFSDYKAGSATAEYNAVIAEATEKIEKAKAKVSPEGRTRLDKLLESYKVKYAEWVNKSNSSGARHVSVMISGPSNYNMRAHEKFLSRESKLWAEYDDIKDIDSKIWAVVNGDKIIKSDDANAIEKLKEKLAKALEEHEGYKAYNIKARKEGKETLAPYVLQNSNGRIKGIKDRIAHLERLAMRAAATPQTEVATEANGIKIIDNLEAQRLQIIFPGKPDASIREQLKKNGFRWCPTVGAWQSYRSNRAERVAREIVEAI